MLTAWPPSRPTLIQFEQSFPKLPLLVLSRESGIQPSASMVLKCPWYLWLYPNFNLLATKCKRLTTLNRSFDYSWCCDFTEGGHVLFWSKADFWFFRDQENNFRPAISFRFQLTLGSNRLKFSPKLTNLSHNALYLNILILKLKTIQCFGIKICHQCDQTLELKVAQISLKVGQNIHRSCNNVKVPCLKWPTRLLIIWVTFARELVAKNFQK